MRVTPQDWLERILAEVGALDTVVLPVAEAHGFTVAEEARARYDLPLWNSSAMDGYALRAADTASASAEHPVELAVTAEVLAGDAADPPLPPRTAVRIMTGAPVPTAADAVVPFELTVHGTRSSEGTSVWARKTIALDSPAAEGANVRRQGEDTAAGTLIARRGDALTAARLASLAAAGVTEVRVSRKPRIAVLATGAELKPSGEPLSRGEIPESNSLLISAMLRECGIEPVAVLRGTDDAATATALLDDLADECDFIVSTGGIGPGSHDVMRIILEREPAVAQVRVAIRPGQPQSAGRLRAGPYMFALPGNPVSAACSFELFVRPALLAAQGRISIHRLRVPARAETPWRGAPGRLQVLPVTLAASASPGDPLLCRPAVRPRGVSHAVGSHGAVQGYALVEADRGDISAGDLVDVIQVAP